MDCQTRRLDRQRFRRFLLENLEDRRLLAGVITQVGYFDTWDGGVIRSTDVAGIAYHPPSGHLYLADSEINELPLFNGDNIFETSLTGDQVYSEIASNNTEPTGITYNEYDGYFYVTNDTGAKTVTRYNSNLNNPLMVISTKDDVPTAKDPEGITSNPSTGFLYVADGRLGGLQILTYNSNLQFQSVFSVANRMEDAEGIAYHAPSNHLFIVDGDQDKVFEYTLNGNYVQEFDIDGFSPEPKSPQGLTFGPTSNPSDNPSNLSLYIADGMSDNYADGRVYEAVLGSGPENQVNVRVASSSDDAEEKPSGNMRLTSGDLELTQDGASQQVVGMRFTGVTIPQGATIQNAYLQFQADEAGSTSTSLTIRGQAINNAPTFTTASGNVSSRATTDANISWTPGSWIKKDQGLNQRTPSIAAVIQEIVDRPGWSDGNSLAIIVTGTGTRTAESFDGKPNAAPLLHVEYDDDQSLHMARSIVNAQPATEPQNAAPPTVVPLDEIQLAHIVDAGIALLSQSGIPTNALAELSFAVVDLPNNMLGRAFPNAIQIDRDAAGFGWFVDLTPYDNSEFIFDTLSNQFVAPGHSLAHGRIDLLTTVMHELGHVLGHEHTDSDGWMDAELSLGTRRLSDHLSSSDIDAFFEVLEPEHRRHRTRVATEFLN